MATLDEKFLSAGGRPAGFDYLRIGLACGVMLFHSMDLMAGRNVAFSEFSGALRPVYSLILPMFFALSGFLVAGSLARSKTLISFLGLRVIRLGPALVVETVLSAIVIGLLFTTLPYRDYFSSWIFWHYFLNIFGDIHYLLPGVFQSHPFQAVNAQLWTVPWELRCYGAVAGLAVMGVARRRVLLISATMLFNTAVLLHQLFSGDQAAVVTLPGIALVLSFLYGLCIYTFRERIVWSMWLAGAAFLAFLGLASPPICAWGDDLLALPGAYLTVFLGLANPPRSRLINSGDYSYGIYLYGYPVQQSVLAVFGGKMMPWWLNFLISMAVVTPLAVGSWHLVEKHAGRFRGALFGVEGRYVKRRGAAAAWLKGRKIVSVADERRI
jgi:peptidoglycan/LPS O-acetylase OafA/YrhL